MRITGFEPARLVTPEPKSGASANSAISAHNGKSVSAKFGLLIFAGARPPASLSREQCRLAEIKTVQSPSRLERFLVRHRRLELPTP